MGQAARRLSEVTQRQSALSSLKKYIILAGAQGLEPGTYGFGDRRSTN